MQDVFITRASEFLPNKPIKNDEMEDYLGKIGGLASRSKKLVLRSNKILSRHYALDKKGNTTHTNAEMTAEAIKKLFNNREDLKTVDILGCGTSSPDQLMPAHGYEVHGLLPQMDTAEVITAASNCCSSMQALKYAYMALQIDPNRKAVIAGSERMSAIMRAKHFEKESAKLKALEEQPYIAFEKDFLRWMLSDGAGAFLLETRIKDASKPALRIDWIESFSYANKSDACMYQGAEKVNEGELSSFKEFTPAELSEKSVFSIKQDVRLLSKNIVSLGFEKVVDLFKTGQLVADDITYFLPHLSSYFFKDKLASAFKENNIHMPMEKWFTNLASKGNIGAASVFVMLNELIEKNKLEKGNKLFVLVPESARFSYAFMQLTVY